MSDSPFVVRCERIGRKQAYKLWFPFHNQVVERIKELPKEDRKWDSATKTWELRVSGLLSLIRSYKNSKKIYFDFGGDDSRRIFIEQIKKIEEEEKIKREKIRLLEENKKVWVEYKKELEENYEKYSKEAHKNLKPSVVLYPHQTVSTMFLNKVRNALLALDMGTGKSLVSIAYCELNEFEKVFVITPNSLKYNYYSEVEKFTNSKAHIIGKKNEYSIEEAKYIIVNYEYFNSSDKRKVDFKFKDLNIGKIDCLICDESHRLKSTKSNTYKNIKRIFKDKIFRDGKVSRVFMSGTPAPSRAAELYSVMNFISSLDFPTKTYFYEYYCGMKYNLDGWGWEVDQSVTKFEELFHKISPYTYRKKKSEVLKDLPEKSYQKVYLEMSPREYDIYYDLEEGVANEFLNANIENPLTIMGKLREYTSYLKVKSVTELIDPILESGEKFVAIDFYKDSLKKLHEKYPKQSALHTGDQKDTERADVVKRFQDDTDSLKIFLGSESTTKEGLTLTAASKVGMLTMPWTPSTLDQCTDRLARIGQKNAVNAYLFIYKDTIDEYIFDLIESKRAEITQVIDGEKYESDINQSIINDLIEIINKKHKEKRKK